MKLKTLIFVFLLLCMKGVSYSQDYILTELPTQEQLPVANIHTIFQDREGYMWYATREGGLCRDNGYHIDVFRSDRSNPSLIGKSNYINDITEDYDNHIIFANRDGLYLIDKHDYSIRLVDKEMKGQSVEPILMASDSTLWTSANQTIFHYDKNLRIMGKYKIMWKGNHQWPCRMSEDSGGTIWITLWKGGILCYDKKSDKLVERFWPEGIAPVNIVEDRENNCYWVSTWGDGIIKYHPEQKEIESQECTTLNGTFTSQVIHMIKDPKKSRLYASTMYGLRAYDASGGSLTEVGLGDMLPKGMGITDYMTFDNRGNLWVAGFSPHTFILSPSNDNIIRKDFGNVKHLLNNRLIVWNSVHEGDYIWLGQERLILCLYNDKTGQISFADHAGIHNYADMNMAKFRKCKTQNGIWGYTGNELYHIWNEGMSIKAELTMTARNTILCVYDAGDGNIYIGHREGIDTYHLVDGKTSWLPVHAKNVSDIIKSETGSLYFCSEDRHLVSLSPTGDDLTLSDIGNFTCMTIDKHGILWAADRQGDLISYNPATGNIVIDEKGSNSKGDYIKSIATDHLGHLWLLSDQEIKEYNPENGNYRILSTSDQEIRMDYFYHVAADGERVWIDGAGAILGIKPSTDLNVHDSDAHPVITSISIDGKNCIIGMGTNHVDIEADAVNIEIQFSTLNHLNAGKVLYAYRLDGIDKQWHYLSQGVNKASFVRLPKGRYTLQLMATDEKGSWCNPVKAIEFNRLPAWYESWWAYLLYLLLAAGVIIFVVGEYVNRQKKRQQKDMEEKLTEMKFRFFTNVSHELRTPLTLIVTPLQSLMKKLKQWHEEDLENERIGRLLSQISLVNDNANRLLTMVNRLLDFRKLEMGQQKLELTSGDVYDFIRTVCETFRPMSQEKGIGLGYAIPPGKSLYMNFDNNKLRHILTNLLSNAFKFTPEGGNIAVSVSETGDGRLCIVVKDTGCGIASKDLAHVFDRYYQSGAQTDMTGTGIGLNMVKEFAQLHGGIVDVESKVGEGTAFIVTLPTTLKSEGKKDAVPVEDDQKTENEIESADSSSDKPTILVVDDNDEFRQFLAGELSENYEIVQASNGQDAEVIVNNQDIDLVVSDVMMPVMDGFELCCRIKHDINTSHVMVILLTARAAEEAKLEGYKSGADDYLSKPFNMEMLRLRITHLLTLRKNRTDKFTAGEEVRVEEIAVNEIDQKFLQDAMAAVEKNLNNEGYDIETFSRDLFMSRSTLYRKILSLTGQKPREFIRTIRLKRAAKLIKENRYSIGEISDMCGFSTVSYFCRCFKSQYGVQPGSYQ